MAIQDDLPKSRLTLTYRTEINGEPETVNLPLRLLVLGDFSNGTSKDRKKDLEERAPRPINNMSAMMKDMGISLKLELENKVDPENSDELEAQLPIENMKSFTPDEIIKNVPKLKGLLLLKTLLLEAESNISNKKKFRKLIADLYSNEEAFNKVKESLKGFENYALPKGSK